MDAYEVGSVVTQTGYAGTFEVVGEWRGYAVLRGSNGTEHKAPRSELSLVERGATDPRADAAKRGTLLLVTTSHPSILTHTLDGEVHPNAGRLVQPRHYSSIAKTAAAGIPWAADNDCFQSLDAVAYTRMLDTLEPFASTCLFVTVPDVVGDADATLALFAEWAPELERRNLPAALVAQDGLENRLDDVEWDRIEAVFIGGSTEWKEGPEAAGIAREAAARGKWVHWGRVNTRRRFDLIVATGAASSFDGSKFARWRKAYLDVGLSWARETAPAPTAGTIDRKGHTCLPTDGPSTRKRATTPTPQSSPTYSRRRSETSAATTRPRSSTSRTARSTGPTSSTTATVASRPLGLVEDLGLERHAALELETQAAGAFAAGRHAEGLALVRDARTATAHAGTLELELAGYTERGTK